MVDKLSFMPELFMPEQLRAELSASARRLADGKYASGHDGAGKFSASAQRLAVAEATN